MLNPRSALVQFNLANLLEERGRLDQARDHYVEAIRLDSAYPDPHFNLALVYERLGKHGKACEQWRAYLRLDPQSRWSAYARSKLEQVPLKVVAGGKAANETTNNKASQ
jgi:tetratricopeptide (TPR) repeat protein